MKLFKLFILFVFFFITNAFSQKVIIHKVKSGESIYAISKKYQVSQTEIYALNPKLKSAVLGLNEEIKIPNKNYKEQEKTQKNEILVNNPQVISNQKNASSSTHIVRAKETLYGISKKYGITMETLCELNPFLKTENLKFGMKLVLPSFEANLVPEKIIHEQNNSVQKISNYNIDLLHKVLPKETLYSISKETGVSIDELTRLNPSVSNGLKINQLLIIKQEVCEDEGNIMEDIEIQKEIETSKPLSFENLAKADILIVKASEHIGTPYRRGGTTSAGFDCSGFILYTFKNIDLSLPRTSQEMANYGQKVEKSQAQKGDLIFFATFGGSRISHVGMITEVLEDEIKFIHSSSSSGVMISSTKESYYARCFVKINRVLED